MSIDSETKQLLCQIYGEVPGELAAELESLYRSGRDLPRRDSLWSEQDIVLITYADQLREEAGSPLSALRRFLRDHQLDRALSCVHLLPFCPYTSDDGFSVTDYLAVDPASGSWSDIESLSDSFELMFDLVLNHSSQQHQWFQRFLERDPDHADFYIEQDPNTDLSGVVRPRSLPLLTKFESAEGPIHVWTTFSPDQVDLNYGNPRVMLEMLRTLVEYARRGARIIRLDAIAYLWKQPGTSCIHLPQTHAAVKLMRCVLDRAAPGTLLLTETNVPHQENVSYFGGGDDEAHIVYQFSLPPLLLDAIHSGTTEVLRDWMASLRPPTPQTTFLNFTASHDGIGVRPLEGLVPDQRVSALAEIVRAHGGRISTRRHPDGRDTPYEFNITYLDAVADRRHVSAQKHAKRFLATQAIMLSLQGLPAVYFHSLVGTPNDQQAVERTGLNRRINRRKFERRELDSMLSDPVGLQHLVFAGYQRMLQIRRSLAGFHPNASQRVLDLPGDGLIGLLRGGGRDTIAVLVNLSERPRSVAASLIDRSLTEDQLSGERLPPGVPIELQPFQVRWLTGLSI